MNLLEDPKFNLMEKIILKSYDLGWSHQTLR